MMYHNKLVAAIKVGGQVLREEGEAVHLPFGSEYKIFLRNLHTERAVIHVSIDGKDVTPGGLVLNAFSDIELERAIEELSHGRMFKFIERTTEIENYRGVGAEDGLVAITYQFEKPTPAVQFYGVWEYNHTPWRTPSPYVPMCRGVVSKGSSAGSPSEGAYFMSCSTSFSGSQTASFDAPGITVEGSESVQRFVTTSVGELGEKFSMVLRLKGYYGELPVVKPVTVKTTKRCPSCGRLFDSSTSYCAKDGTYLKLT